MISSKPLILIVVNPISGGRNKRRFIFMARKFFQDRYFVHWIFWKRPEQDIVGDIRKEITRYDYRYVVAAGGDGTVNQTAKALIGTEIPMGIIPLGSGNGLARHLGYRIRIREAMDVLCREKAISIDVAYINGQVFFCSSGTGFDAHIGHIFAGLNRRGPANYVKSVVVELGKYRSQSYIIYIDGVRHIVKAFLITVANAGQYGNNAWIAPRASLQDGLLDVTVLSPFNIVQAPDLAIKLFRKRIDKNHKVETFRGKSVIIETAGNGLIPVHYDGEPATMKGPLVFNINELALKVIVP